MLPSCAPCASSLRPRSWFKDFVIFSAHLFDKIVNCSGGGGSDQNKSDRFSSFLVPWYRRNTLCVGTRRPKKRRLGSLDDRGVSRGRETLGDASELALNTSGTQVGPSSLVPCPISVAVVVQWKDVGLRSQRSRVRPLPSAQNSQLDKYFLEVSIRIFCQFFLERHRVPVWLPGAH